MPLNDVNFKYLAQGCKTILCILFYYTFSIGITFYNKWMFSRFKFPISTTMIHFTITFSLTALSRELLACKSRKKRIVLSWDVFLLKVLPTGIISALDIGLSNWSFMFITVSLYTMVKSSCVLWILMFSLLLGLEKPRWNLIIIILCISCGLFLFVFKSTQFNLEGFILVLLASFLGGARWTLSQVLCQKNEIGLSNPIDAVYHLTPTMIIGLFPIFIGHETAFLVSKATFNAPDSSTLFMSICMIAAGGILAFFLSVSEYLLLSYTSSLTLSISGIFKELCTLIIATKIGTDILTPINWVGFCICIIGILIHVRNKFNSSQMNSSSSCSTFNENFSKTSNFTNSEEQSALISNIAHEENSNSSSTVYENETTSKEIESIDNLQNANNLKLRNQYKSQYDESDGFSSIPLD